MKICIDPGHGKANKKWGSYDPGATHGGVQEASLALAYAIELRDLLSMRDIPVFMTRTSKDDPAPLGLRCRRATEAGCTHLVSLHFNAAENEQANGVEVLYRRPEDRQLAERIVHALGSALGLRVRGAIVRDDLTILRFPGPAVLIEFGFLPNAHDRAVVTSEPRYREALQTLTSILITA